MKLGILGGTFDPPHIAHLVLADEACAQLQLDCILWVLTADPPHKQGQPVTDVHTRLQMTQAAIRANPAFQLSDVDIDRPAPHYALDTVRLLQRQNPASKFIYLMGADSLFDLPTWHRPQEFIQTCDGIGVLRRPGYRPDLALLESQIPGIETKLTWIEAPLLQISSTDIRQRVAAAKPYRYLLPDPVYDIIRSQGLYRE